MIAPAISRLSAGESLDRSEARELMLLLMKGEATDAQIGALLVALRMKGETAEEVAGLAEGMREAATMIDPGRSPLLDTCGTGGDRLKTFNISTAAAFVAAGAGVSVAKHGNRAVSSTCGSADVLEALGVAIDLPAERVQACIAEIGIGFLFAPRFHPAMRHVMAARRELGIPTTFNILGPLANPAGASAQLLGVGMRKYGTLMAGALREIGISHAMVVHAYDGMDELTNTSLNFVWEIEDGYMHEYVLDAGGLGMGRASIDELAGGDAPTNAAIIRDEVLAGALGPRRQVTILNAAAAIYLAGLAANIEEGVELARRSIDTGAAREKLSALVDFSCEATA
jgi:anthranilate phosphoribosyltransferase